MEDNKTLIEALRCCGNTDTKRPDCEHCPLNGHMCVKRMLEGAAGALEAHDAQLAAKDKRLAAAEFIRHLDREYSHYIADPGFERWRGPQEAGEVEHGD